MKIVARRVVCGVVIFIVLALAVSAFERNLANQKHWVGNVIALDTVAVVTNISADKDKVTFTVESSELFDKGSSVTWEVDPRDLENYYIQVNDRVWISIICTFSEHEFTPDSQIYMIERCDEMKRCD